MELLTTLGIDWKLLIAQLVNFGLLIVILTYLVYRPILRVLDARREKARKTVEDAEAAEKQRRSFEQFRAEQMRKVDQEMRKFLEDAKKQAEAARREILDSAQREAEHMLARAKQQLDEERTKLVSSVQGSLTKTVVKLAEKLLEKEFSPSDQQRILQSLEKTIPAAIR